MHKEVIPSSIGLIWMILSCWSSWQLSSGDCTRLLLLNWASNLLCSSTAPEVSIQSSRSRLMPMLSSSLKNSSLGVNSLGGTRNRSDRSLNMRSSESVWCWSLLSCLCEADLSLWFLSEFISVLMTSVAALHHWKFYLAISPGFLSAAVILIILADRGSLSWNSDTPLRSPAQMPILFACSPMTT